MSTRTKICLWSLGFGLVIALIMTISHFRKDTPATTKGSPPKAAEVTAKEIASNPATTTSPGAEAPSQNDVPASSPAPVGLKFWLGLSVVMLIIILLAIFLRQLARGKDGAWLILLLLALIAAGVVIWQHFGTIIVTKHMESKYEVPVNAHPEVHEVTSTKLTKLGWEKALKLKMKARWGIMKPEGYTLAVFQSEKEPDPTAEPDLVIGPERVGYVQIWREPKADGSYLRESTEPLWVVVLSDDLVVIEIKVVYVPYKL